MKLYTDRYYVADHLDSFKLAIKDARERALYRIHNNWEKEREGHIIQCGTYTHVCDNGVIGTFDTYRPLMEQKKPKMVKLKIARYGKRGQRLKKDKIVWVKASLIPTAEDADNYGVIRYHCGCQMSEEIDAKTDDIWMKCQVCGAEVKADDYENLDTGRAGFRTIKDILMKTSYLLYKKWKQDTAWEWQKSEGMKPVGFSDGYVAYVDGKQVVRLENTQYLNKCVADLDPEVREWVKENRKFVSNIYFDEKKTEEVYCTNDDPEYNKEYIAGPGGNVDEHAIDFHNRGKVGKEVGVTGWKRRALWKNVANCIKTNDVKELEKQYNWHKYAGWLSDGEKEYIKEWLYELKCETETTRIRTTCNATLAAILS